MVLTTLLLQRILGSGPSVKYGAGSGVLSAAAASVGGNVAASGVCQVNILTMMIVIMIIIVMMLLTILGVMKCNFVRCTVTLD